MIRFCGIITLGPTFQKLFCSGLFKRPAKPEETRRFFSQKKLDAIVGIAAQALGTALEKKAEDIVEGIKGKITKRLREEPLNWNPNPKLKTMLRKKQRTTYRRGQSRPSKAYVARIARSVVRRNEETKCFTQTLLNGTSSTNSWEFKSALAGLTQGTSTTTELVLELLLWQLSTLLRLLLLWLP